MLWFLLTWLFVSFLLFPIRTRYECIAVYHVCINFAIATISINCRIQLLWAHVNENQQALCSIPKSISICEHFIRFRSLNGLRLFFSIYFFWFFRSFYFSHFHFCFVVVSSCSFLSFEFTCKSTHKDKWFHIQQTSC